MKHPFILCCLIVSLFSSPVVACGYDGLLNNPFTLSQPGSIQVALRTQQAINQGLLSRPPSLTGHDGLARVMGWLEQLRSRLEQAQLPSSFSLYLLDANLWTRFDALGANVLLQSHVRPEQNELVLLSTEAGLHALLTGALTPEQAEQLQLIRWSARNDEQVNLAFRQAISAVPVF